MSSFARGLSGPKQYNQSLSREVLDRLIFETLLADTSAKFVRLPPDLVDQEISAAQKGICECLGLDQSSLWQAPPNQSGKLVLTHYYRVQESDLPPPPAKMDGADFFPWAFGELSKGENVYLPDISQAPSEAAKDVESWRYFKVKSALAIPLSAGGGPTFGVLTFDSTRHMRDFSYSFVGRLRLIAEVFANALQRKFAEQKLRESEARLSLAANSSAAGLWSIDTNSGEIWATDVALSLFGVKPGEAFRVAELLQLIHLQDRQAVQAAIARAMSSGEEVQAEYRVVLADGSERWLVSRGRRHCRGDGEPHTLMGVTVEVTERKRAELERSELARKLLDAKEVEATRIARELHDDVGQRVVIFSLRLKKTVEKIAPTTPALQKMFADMQAEITSIGSRISSLSHQLHSSELEYLGLSNAAQALCRQVAEQHAINISCSSPELVRLDADIELSLYRVLQETLSNAVRHGQAKNIDVSLEVNDGIYLRVTDDGCGFDSSREIVGPGLGLISIKERARLLDGECSIVSTPKQGTTVSVRVPLREPLSVP